VSTASTPIHFDPETGEEHPHSPEPCTLSPGCIAYLFLDDDGHSLYGSCSHCRRRVDNHDDLHRVSAIMRGGRGVECVLRGDITGPQAQLLGRADLHLGRKP
jgi:hypothetical protein